MTLLLILLFALAAPQSQTIDRILAVVAGRPILLSDVTAALRLRLVDASGAEDPVRAGLDGLIDRQLQLAEVDRYLPPEPPPGEVDAAVAAVRGRFAGPSDFEAALGESGVTPEQLRERLRDDLRIDAYLEGRFGATLQPSDEQVLAYYRAHDADFRRDGLLQPFAEVRSEARARLLDEQRASVEREWLAGLRRRADVSDLYGGPR
jgi:hypothetical protein